MKFLKNNLKVIISFILGLILAGGIVYAAVTSASEVTYTTDKNGEIKNVEQALNDLYAKKKEAKLIKKIISTFTYTPRTDSSSPYYGTKTFDVKEKISNYNNLTKENFCLQANYSSIQGTNNADTGNAGRADFSISSYDNGIITVELSRGIRSNWGADTSFSIIAYYIDYE